MAASYGGRTQLPADASTIMARLLRL